MTPNEFRRYNIWLVELDKVAKAYKTDRKTVVKALEMLWGPEPCDGETLRTLMSWHEAQLFLEEVSKEA